MSIKNVVTNVKVVGAGGAGCNIIMSMLKTMLNDYTYSTDFIMMNTDCQSLNEPLDIVSPGESNIFNKNQEDQPETNNLSDQQIFNERKNVTNAQILNSNKNLTLTRIQLGNNGLGAGSDPEVGKSSAEYSRDDIEKALVGADLVIICAGFGGGTGSGSAPVIASIAKKLDILVIGIVTKPFDFEGPCRMKTALKAIEEFRANADTTIVISNQLLFKVTNNFTVVKDAFNIVDNMFIMFLKCLMTMLHHCGLINIDFSDVKTTIKQKGDGVIGVGFSNEEDAAIIATKKALDNPLSDNSAISSATNALVYITGNNMSLSDVETIMQLIRQSLGPDVYMIHGISIVDKLPMFSGIQDIFGTSNNYDSVGNERKWILVTLIITGIVQNHAINIDSRSHEFLFNKDVTSSSNSLFNNNEDELLNDQNTKTETDQKKSNLFHLLSKKFSSK